MAEEQTLPTQPGEELTEGQKVFGKTSGERELEARQAKDQQANFNRAHQTAYPINTDINSSIIGDFNTGPAPSVKTSPAVDFAKNAAQYLKQADSWANDKYGYGKTFSYGAGYRNMNFDRYYSHSGFKKLGFSPFRDNEKVYNENTSGFADFGRMASGWLGMAGLGVKDTFSEWYDNGLDSDLVHSEDMNKRMANMSSSREGAAGWITNFGATTAYSAGIIGEIALEELGLLAITVATDSGAAPLTGGRLVSNITSLPRRLSEGFTAMNNIRKALSSIDSVNKARQLFSWANAGQTALGVAKWANPLSRTAEFVGSLSELKNLSNFAKMSKGVGSLYRDIREINAVTSESKLEGGSAQIDLNEKLVNDFYEQNDGRLPEGDEANKIYEQSKAAGFATTLANIPLIYFSNKIVFKNALRGFKPVQRFLVEEAEGALAGKILVKDPLSKTARFVDKYSLPGIKNVFRPGNLLKGSLRYTVANLTEGLQETSQDVISQAFKSYYEQDYKDPDLASLKSSFSASLDTQLSGQGLNTFLSGFLMGGILQGPQKAMFEGIPTLTKKIFDPKGYASYSKAKQEYINSVTEAIIDTMKDPAKYVKAISLIDKNFVLQKKSNAHVDQAIEDNDQKAFENSIDESVFIHIYTLLKSGQTNSLTDQIKSLKEMSPAELSEAFGEKPGTNDTSYAQKLDSFTDKVDYLRNRFDVIEKKMVNSFDPSKVKDPTAKIQEYHAREAFDELKKMALFSRYSFDRTLDRMTDITQDAVKSKLLAKASSSAFTLLFDPTQIQDEIDSLKLEIPTYTQSTTAGDKAIAKKKEAILESLIALKLDIIGFQAAIKARSTSATPEQEEDLASAEHAKLLYDSYSKYIKTIANLSDDHILDEDVNNAFRKLKDFYELNEDSVRLASAVNFLTNPETFREAHSRAVEAATVASNNRINYLREGLEEFIKKSEYNEFLNELYKLGAFFDSKEIESLTDTNKLPTKFYSVTSPHGEIPLNSEKGKQILNLIEQFEKATGKQYTEKPIPETQDTTPGYESFARRKFKGDQRTYEDYAKEYGFNSADTESKVISTRVLRNIITGKYSTLREKALARRLLSITKPEEVILFRKDSVSPGSYNPETGIVIDARYSSVDYKSGNNPIEHVILHQLIHKYTTEGIDTDPQFKSDITSLLERARQYSTTEEAKSKYGEAPLNGLSSEKEFAAEAISNDTFQSFLKEIPHEVTQKSTWTDYLNSVKKFFQRLFKVSTDSTLLDQVISLITTKIDTTNVTVTPGGETITTGPASITIATPINQLPEDLRATLISTYRDQNSKLVPEEQENLATLSDDQIAKSLRFKNWIIGFPSAHKILDEFNTRTGRVPEEVVTLEEPVKPTQVIQAVPEVVGDEEILDFQEKVIVTPERMNSIAQKINNNEKLSEGENAIYKSKFAEIDKIAAELKPKEAAIPIIEPELEVIVAAPVPTRSLEARFKDVTTMEQLELLEGELIEDLSTPAIRKAQNLSGELINQMIEDKKKELALSINFDDIKDGEILVMKDKSRYGKTGLGEVVGKTKDTIKVVRYGENGATVYYEPISEIEFKYNEGMEEADLTPDLTTEDKTQMKSNVKAEEDLLKDKSEVDRLHDEATKKSKEENDEEFLSDLGCGE